MAITIRPARVPGEMAVTRDLFEEYQKWLDVDL